MIEVKSICISDLRELWEISYGSKADLQWMKFNGPYFKDSVQSWEDFSVKFDRENKAIILSDEKIIGLLTAHFEDGNLEKWLEFGICIYDSKLWGKRIGQNVLPVWISQLFDQYPEIQRLGFTTWSGNPGMMKLGEKLGMKEEARIRKVRYWKDEYYDSVKYGILRDEWFEKEN